MNATVVALLERVRAQGPAIDATAPANTDATELPRAVVAALDAAGIFAMMAPRAETSRLRPWLS